MSVGLGGKLPLPHPLTFREHLKYLVGDEVLERAHLDLMLACSRAARVPNSAPAWLWKTLLEVHDEHLVRLRRRAR